MRRWHVTIRWDEARHSPMGVATYSTRVDTPAALRRLIERARADPHVIAFPYESVRELAGDKPQECRRGHLYDGGSATRALLGWAQCGCGGHVIYLCQACDDDRLDPAPGPDCVPRRSHAT